LAAAGFLRRTNYGGPAPAGGNPGRRGARWSALSLSPPVFRPALFEIKGLDGAFCGVMGKF